MISDPAAEAQPSQHCVPSLVLLRSGNNRPPVFMSPGLGDRVAGLASLATFLPEGPPIYAVQTSGLEGIGEPLDRIEDMAAFHLDAIRRAQAHGPYLLIGYSLGGLVMLEVARRLSRSGQKIALLVMLDSYPDRRYLPPGPRVRLLWQLSRARVGSLLGKRENQGRSPVIASPQAEEAGDAILEIVKSAQYRALRTYRPAFYDGKVNFVRAAIPTHFPADPRPVWSNLVREFTVETVEGIHVEMLTTHAASVAATISGYLGEVPLE
jgi:thioesterase domain-containing protein